MGLMKPEAAFNCGFSSEMMGEGDTLKLPGASTVLAGRGLQCIVKTLGVQCPVSPHPGSLGLSFLVCKMEALEDMMCNVFLCLETSYMIGFSGTFCHLGHTLSHEMTILTL